MKFVLQIGKNNTILRAKAEMVGRDEVRKYTLLAEQMVKYVKNTDHGCVGLAAPQIGTSKRIIAVSLMRDYEDENYKTIAMINPEIIDRSEISEIGNEGCLSVPGEHGDVERYTKIKVRYLDTSGKESNILLQGLAARIVQHEIDHLDGVLFTDKVVQKETVPVMKNL